MIHPTWVSRKCSFHAKASTKIFPTITSIFSGNIVIEFSSVVHEMRVKPYSIRRLDFLYTKSVQILCRFLYDKVLSHGQTSNMVNDEYQNFFILIVSYRRSSKKANISEHWFCIRLIVIWRIELKFCAYFNTMHHFLFFSFLEIVIFILFCLHMWGNAKC